MPSLWASLRRSSSAFWHFIGLQSTTKQSQYKFPRSTGVACYQEGDRVIVTNKEGKNVRSRLIAPLKLGGTTTTGRHSYQIKHSDIIGKPSGRLIVDATSVSKKDLRSRFRVTHPSLDQFIALVPRTVTPIYSAYSATIVTLLDIHVTPPLASNDPQTSNVLPLEILEAGTGNGGLTLHLSRAIAAANPPPPQVEKDRGQGQLEQAWIDWRLKRRAVVHTVEFQEPRSWATEKLIQSFRGGLYWPHIDFHSGDVGAWVKNEHDKRRQSRNSVHGFLDIVILDLPAVHQQVPNVVEAIKNEGQLLVWVPQITQVAACQQEIESLGLPLKLDQVVELGEGISNGRKWDLRFVKTRAEQKKGQEKRDEQIIEEEEESFVPEPANDTIRKETDVHDDEVSRTGNKIPPMVCRPMVGELIMGGGFIGLWRKVMEK